MNNITNLAHIALYTSDLEASIAFYKKLGGALTDRADIKKATGTNRLAMVSMPGFYLEIIEPHDGSPVTADGGLYPHLALEVDDIELAVRELKEAGVSSFRTDAPVNMPDLFGGIRNIFFTGINGELIELLEHIKL